MEMDEEALREKFQDYLIVEITDVLSSDETESTDWDEDPNVEILEYVVLSDSPSPSPELPEREELNCSPQIWGDLCDLESGTIELRLQSPFSDASSECSTSVTQDLPSLSEIDLEGVRDSETSRNSLVLDRGNNKVPTNCLIEDPGKLPSTKSRSMDDAKRLVQHDCLIACPVNTASMEDPISLADTDEDLGNTLLAGDDSIEELVNLLLSDENPDGLLLSDANLGEETAHLNQLSALTDDASLKSTEVSLIEEPRILDEPVLVLTHNSRNLNTVNLNIFEEPVKVNSTDVNMLEDSELKSPEVILFDEPLNSPDVNVADEQENLELSEVILTCEQENVSDVNLVEESLELNLNKDVLGKTIEIYSSDEVRNTEEVIEKNIDLSGLTKVVSALKQDQWNSTECNDSSYLKDLSHPKPVTSSSPSQPLPRTDKKLKMKPVVVLERLELEELPTNCVEDLVLNDDTDENLNGLPSQTICSDSDNNSFSSNKENVEIIVVDISDSESDDCEKIEASNNLLAAKHMAMECSPPSKKRKVLEESPDVDASDSEIEEVPTPPFDPFTDESESDFDLAICEISSEDAIVSNEGASVDHSPDQHAESSSLPELEMQSEPSAFPQPSQSYGKLPFPVTRQVDGRKIEALVAPTCHNNAIFWVVKFEGNDCLDVVPADIMNKSFSQNVIGFLERRYSLGSCS